MPGTPEPMQPPMQKMLTPERRLEALKHVNRERSGLGFLWDWAKIFTISVVMFFAIKTFLIEAFKIPSGSMERTLLVGDFLLVNKVVYGAELPLTGGRRLPGIRSPSHGDVIVFEWPVDRSKNFVKRLVGLPGDTVGMRDGILIRNGVALAEPYVTHNDPDADPVSEEFHWQLKYLAKAPGAALAYHPSRNNWGPLVVPGSEYFVLGDNRDNSLDSRYWGFVPDSLLRGRPEVVYFSFAPDSADDFSLLTHVRWTRLGERVH